jgi:DNA replication protein DnaC
LINQTLEQLRAMRLYAMADACQYQAGQPDITALSFEERFSLIVEHEWTDRQNRHLGRLLRDAHLRLPACMEDVEYNTARGLDRSFMLRLATCEWLANHLNVIITGLTGCGKTYVASALGNAACRQGHTVRYYRVSQLLSDLAIARADGTHAKLFGSICKAKLLILDDWGLVPCTQGESREILDLVEERYNISSCIIVSQIPVDHWHEVLVDPTMADAILDRLVHNAYKIALTGPSMRRLKSPFAPDAGGKTPVIEGGGQ